MVINVWLKCSGVKLFKKNNTPIKINLPVIKRQIVIANQSAKSDIFCMLMGKTRQKNIFFLT